MARSQYGLKKTFGPGIIQQQVYNDKAKANKELVVSTIPDEVISFHLAPGTIPTAASLAVTFTSAASTYEVAEAPFFTASVRDYFELRGPRDVYRFALQTSGQAASVSGAIRVNIDSSDIDVMGNNLVIAMNGLTFRDLSGVSYAITVAYDEGTNTLSITFPTEAGALGNNIEFIFNEFTGADVTFTFGTITGETAQHLSGGADAIDSMIRVGKGNIVRLRSTITSDLVIEFEDDESATAVHTDVSALALSNQHGLYLEKPSAETLDATFIADGEYMTIYHVGGSFSNTLYIRIEITEDE